ncbi:MAG: hypothetical protein AB8B74_03125 [Crocinitomicaceae bacterium]
MKKLFLIIILLSLSINLSAQTSTNYPVRVSNTTACPMFVTMQPIESYPGCGSDDPLAVCCITLAPITVVVMPFGGIAWFPGITGYHYEVATVSTAYPFPSPTDYHTKIQAPNSAWLPGWIGEDPHCYLMQTYPHWSQALATCSGTVISAVWQGHTTLQGTIEISG